MSAAVAKITDRAIELPDTMAGRQLGMLFSRLRAPEPIQEACLSELFAPSFLAAAGSAALAAGLEAQRELVVSGSLVRVAGRGEEQVSAILENSDLLTRFELVVDEANGRIAMLHAFPTGPSSGITWAQLLESEPPGASHSSLPDALSARLDDIAMTARSLQQLPGIIAAVTDEAGTIKWMRTVGVAGLDPLRAPTSEVRLRIGSISKTMTALLVMQLVERGEVELDGFVNDYLTAYNVQGPQGQQLTVRSLLNHTSGLGMRPGIDVGCAPGSEPTLAEFYGPQLVGQLPPGTDFLYSNDAFATLGQMVADCTGKSLAEQARGSLFIPLGMHDTSYEVSGLPARPSFQGIDVDAGELATVPDMAVIIAGAGSVYSTLGDMALYGAAIHGRGANQHGRVLSEESFAMLMQAEEGVQGLPPGIQPCLAWMRADVPGAKMWWHNGGWPGAKSEIGVLPELGRTVLIFANTLSADIDGVCMQLAATLAAEERP